VVKGKAVIARVDVNPTIIRPQWHREEDGQIIVRKGAISFVSSLSQCFSSSLILLLSRNLNSIVNEQLLYMFSSDGQYNNINFDVIFNVDSP
jgi:hypothetical protein